MAPIHDRMPVILPAEVWGEWLGAAELTPERRDAVLAPHPAEEMEAVAVSRLVNSPANDEPSCLEPAS